MSCPAPGEHIQLVSRDAAAPENPRLTVKVDDDLAAFIDQAAKAGEGSRADVINRAIKREIRRRAADRDAQIYASSSDVARPARRRLPDRANGLEIDELDRDDTGAVQQRDPLAIEC